MVMLVDLDTVKAGLRIDHDGDDENLENLLIPSASALVLNYLKVAHDLYDDSFGDAVGVPDEVRNATVLLVGILLNGKDPEIFTHGYLPNPVTSLLYPLRDPALA